MALLGKAVMINWSDVLMEHRPDYFEWHNHEHIAGRLEVPGFRRGRRHIAVDADRDIFNLYEVDDLDVLTGAEYRQRTGNPSELTRKVGKTIVNAIRALARVRFSAGLGQGGVVRTLRFDAATAGAEGLERFLVRQALPAVAACADIVGVHLCVADMDASTEVSVERRGRPTAVPAWAIIIEATSAEAAAQACARHLQDADMLRHGAAGPITPGVYALQISMSQADLQAPQSTPAP